MRKQIEEGRQVYIVYPLIKESEKIDLKNLEEGFLHICAWKNDTGGNGCADAVVRLW